MKAFEPFRLDLGNESLWRGTERIPLTPKAFSLLSYLVSHAGTLITQNDLIEQLWPDTFVQPEVLKTHIRDLRCALGDNARTPTYIETQHRRGYRFIAPVTEFDGEPERGSDLSAENGAPRYVGQEKNLATLRAILQEACAGKPQLVFVTGEVGIGKTALANSLEREVVTGDAQIRVVRGQCVEGFAIHEAYYPVLEALSNLLRLPGRDRVVEALARHAPTWMTQFPGQVDVSQNASLQREAAGATRERMMRELCEALETIANEAPLVILLEDVHWADPYTVHWLSTFAQRGRSTRLMVLATIRPVSLALSESPLKAAKQRLLLQRLCREVAVGSLDEAAVEKYLKAKAPGSELPAGLVQLIFRHSEGNPFFIGLLLEHFIEHGWLTTEDGRWCTHLAEEKPEEIVPETLRQALESHIQFRLNEDERTVLEAASICGVSFSAVFVDTAAGKSQEAVEEVCETLSRRSHFVRTLGTLDLPNGHSSSQFQFVHSLYREIIYRRTPPARRLRLHRQIALRMEELYQGSLEEIAPRLAYHFEKGAEWLKAATYLLLVADGEVRHFVYSNAALLLEQALSLLLKLTSEQAATVRVQIQIRLAEIYALTDSFAKSIEQLEAALRSPALHADPGRRIEVLLRLAYQQVRFSGQKCLQTSKLALELSQQGNDPAQRAMAQVYSSYWQLQCVGWDDGQGRVFHASVAELETCGSPAEIARARGLSAIVHLLMSRYKHGLADVKAGMQLLAQSGDVVYRGTQTSEVWLLLFSGQWGAALDLLHNIIDLARKDNNLTRQRIWQIWLGWVHQQALDHAGAARLCGQSSEDLEGYEAAWMMRCCLVLEATSEVQLGKLKEAREHLERSTVQEGQGAWLDWKWAMLRHFAEVELALRSGDLRLARECCHTLLASTESCADHTWKALAWETAARVALAEKDASAAADSIQKALRTMEGYQVPLAHWRVHKTAMQVFPNKREEHRKLAWKTVQELAASLGNYPELKQIFLSSPQIAQLEPEVSHAPQAGSSDDRGLKSGSPTFAP